MVRLRGADPRTQQWNLEDFKEYFKNERGNLGNSKKFQGVIRAFDQVAGLRGQPVNQETAIKMVKANEKLKKACEAYVESRRGASGGYFLKRRCEDMCVYDLFQVLGEPPLINRCQREGYQCENFPQGGCGVCRELCRIQDILNQELQRTPLSDIFQ